MTPVKANNHNVVRIGAQLFNRESYPRYSKAGTVVMCQGIYDLLYGVILYESLSKAAKEMGMPYSKACEIINKASEHIPLLVPKEARGSKVKVSQYGLTLMEYWRQDVGYF